MEPRGGGESVERRRRVRDAAERDHGGRGGGVEESEGGREVHENALEGGQGDEVEKDRSAAVVGNGASREILLPLPFHHAHDPPPHHLPVCERSRRKPDRLPLHRSQKGPFDDEGEEAGGGEGERDAVNLEVGINVVGEGGEVDSEGVGGRRRRRGGRGGGHEGSSEEHKQLQKNHTTHVRGSTSTTARPNSQKREPNWGGVRSWGGRGEGGERRWRRSGRQRGEEGGV